MSGYVKHSRSEIEIDRSTSNPKYSTLKEPGVNVGGSARDKAESIFSHFSICVWKYLQSKWNFTGTFLSSEPVSSFSAEIYINIKFSDGFLF